MSADPNGRSSPPRSTVRRILILGVVILTTTLYGTTLLVVSTILPQIQGTMSATPDEIAWVVVSDHGEGLGDHGIESHGWAAYESIARVPLLLRLPGEKPGGRSKQEREAKQRDRLDHLGRRKRPMCNKAPGPIRPRRCRCACR